MEPISQKRGIAIALALFEDRLHSKEQACHRA
jgi:hypothetical protein